MDTTSDSKTPSAPEQLRRRPAAPNGDTASPTVKRHQKPTTGSQPSNFLDALLRALSMWSS
jgi:hypothetical protein